VRRVAQLLQTVERGCLCRILRRVIVDHDNASPRSADPHHLLQHGRGVEKVVEREACGHDREAAIHVGQGRDVALPPGDVCQALVGRQLAGPLDHRRGHVDPGRLLNMWGKGADDEARAARHVEKSVDGGGPCRLDDHSQRVVVGDRRGSAEDRRLPRELVEDQLPVVRVRHFQSGPFGSTSTLPFLPPCWARTSAGLMSSIG